MRVAQGCLSWWLKKSFDLLALEANQGQILLLDKAWTACCTLVQSGKGFAPWFPGGGGGVMFSKPCADGGGGDVAPTVSLHYFLFLVLQFNDAFISYTLFAGNCNSDWIFILRRIARRLDSREEMVGARLEWLRMDAYALYTSIFWLHLLQYIPALKHDKSKDKWAASPLTFAHCGNLQRLLNEKTVIHHAVLSFLRLLLASLQSCCAKTWVDRFITCWLTVPLWCRKSSTRTKGCRKNSSYKLVLSPKVSRFAIWLLASNNMILITFSANDAILSSDDTVYLPGHRESTAVSRLPSDLWIFVKPHESWIQLHHACKLEIWNFVVVLKCLKFIQIKWVGRTLVSCCAFNFKLRSWVDSCCIYCWFSLVSYILEENVISLFPFISFWCVFYCSLWSKCMVNGLFILSTIVCVACGVWLLPMLAEE